MTSNQKIYRVLKKIKNVSNLSSDNVVEFNFNYSAYGVGVVSFHEEVLILEKLRKEHVIKIGEVNDQEMQIKILKKFSKTLLKYFIKCSVNDVLVYLKENLIGMIIGIIKLVIKVKRSGLFFLTQNICVNKRKITSYSPTYK